MRWFKKIRPKSIKQTVVFVDLAIVFPLLILFFIVLAIIFQESNYNLNQTKLQALEDKGRSVASTNSELVKMTNAFYLDTKMNSLASKKNYDTRYEYLNDRRSVQTKMRELTGMYADYRYQMMLLCTNGTSFFEESLETAGEELALQDLAGEDWYAELMETNGEIYFLPKYRSKLFQERFPEEALFAARLVRNFNGGRVVAVLVVALSDEMWKNDVLQFHESTENSMMVDQYGKIIFASDPSMYGMTLADSSYYGKIAQHEKGFFLGNVNEIYSHIRFATVPDTQWKLIAYSDYQHVWSKYAVVIVALGGMLLLVIFFMVRYNCTFIYRKIKNINDNILEVSRGNLQTRIQDDYESEFEELCTNFNTMLDCIENLMVQLEREEKEKYALEFQALQAQINPHFFYNTVATIRFMIQMEQYEDADRAMLAFSKLLRKSFADSRKIIPIRDELELAGEYMSLMQIRHQNTFEWKIHMDPEIASCGILKNTIQPLVENSISHGFNMKEELGHIVIEVCREDGKIVVTISDDGVGADLEQIQEQIQVKTISMDKEQFSGIGLANVQLRIRRNFGRAYGLGAAVNEQGGLTFRMTFPAIALEEESN